MDGWWELLEGLGPRLTAAEDEGDGSDDADMAGLASSAPTDRGPGYAEARGRAS